MSAEQLDWGPLEVVEINVPGVPRFLYARYVAPCSRGEYSVGAAWKSGSWTAWAPANQPLGPHPTAALAQLRCQQHYEEAQQLYISLADFMRQQRP